MLCLGRECLQPGEGRHHLDFAFPLLLLELLVDARNSKEEVEQDFEQRNDAHSEAQAKDATEVCWNEKVSSIR